MRWFRAAIFLALFVFGEMQDDDEKIVLDTSKDNMQSGAVLANSLDDRKEPIDIEDAIVTSNQVILRDDAKNETAILCNTGESVETRLAQGSTSEEMTGRTLGNYLFVYTRTEFYWGKSAKDVAGTEINGAGGTGLEVSILYYNTKYRSFFDSTNYRDGLLEIRLRVNVTSKKDNPKFTNFGKKMKSIIKEGCVNINLLDNSWYFNYPTCSYYAYAGSLKNATTGETKVCAITVVPEVVLKISQTQFQVFLDVKNESNEPLITKQKTYSSKGHTIIHNMNAALINATAFFGMQKIPSIDGYGEDS